MKNNLVYEYAAEEMAIKRLLNGKRFNHAVDVGAGVGRLAALLGQYADKLTLAERAGDLTLKDNSVDLVTMIRVIQHLPEPQVELAEISRILSKDGYAIIEVANYLHGRNRLKHLLKGKRMPLDPVDIRSAASRRNDETALVNHNPHTVIKQLAHAGLRVDRMLSVSNLRNPSVKRLMPQGLMLAVENILQPTLAATFFGPSVFFLVRKA